MINDEMQVVARWTRSVTRASRFVGKVSIKGHIQLHATVDV